MRQQEVALMKFATASYTSHNTHQGGETKPSEFNGEASQKLLSHFILHHLSIKNFKSHMRIKTY